MPSMYEVFTYIYHKNQLITNVGKYKKTYMEGMGYKQTPGNIFFGTWNLEQDGKGQIPNLESIIS